VTFPFSAGALWLFSTLSALFISVTIMAQECPLSAPLTIKDTQSGFAGETGMVWTIAPDCTYTVARQIGLQVLAPEKHGRLTPEQQSQLKELLDRMPSTGMPTELGGQPQANARRITLSYGKTASTLTLAPGAGGSGPPSAARGTDPAATLLELADRIKAMTAS
jgi:hypothetical protein